MKICRLDTPTRKHTGKEEEKALTVAVRNTAAPQQGNNDCSFAVDNVETYAAELSVKAMTQVVSHYLTSLQQNEVIRSSRKKRGHSSFLLLFPMPFSRSSICGRYRKTAVVGSTENDRQSRVLRGTVLLKARNRQAGIPR